MRHWPDRRAKQIFAALEQTPDIGRGQARFAAEVALCELRGCHVPTFAHERAFETLKVLAKG